MGLLPPWRFEELHRGYKQSFGADFRKKKQGSWIQR